MSDTVTQPAQPAQSATATATTTTEATPIYGTEAAKAWLAKPTEPKEQVEQVEQAKQVEEVKTEEVEAPKPDVRAELKQKSIILRKEKEFRDKEIKLSEKYKAIEQFESKVKEIGSNPVEIMDAIKDIKLNPMAFLDKIGWSQDKLIDLFMGRASPEKLMEPPVEDKINNLQKNFEQKFNELEQKRLNEEKARQESKKQQETEVINKQVEEVVEGFTRNLDNKVKNEYIYIAAQPQGTKMALERLFEASEKSTGEVDEKVVLDALESELKMVHDKAQELQSKRSTQTQGSEKPWLQKVQQKVTEPTYQKPAINTLTNKISSTPSAELRAEDEADRVAAAKAWLRQTNRK